MMNDVYSQLRIKEKLMSQFMLLLHENPASFASVSAEEIQAVIADYNAWRAKLEAAGRIRGGNKLKDEGGRHLSLNNGKLRVVDGPFAEAKEVMGGYFIVEASSYDDAIKISEECPHLKYGGRIELREVDLLGEG
jgi:hypothetical protein